LATDVLAFVALVFVVLVDFAPEDVSVILFV
jgi:hypothetical protein